MSAVKRAACDRCHGQKMRCIREPTRSSCNRCLAASALCIFSLARKAGRPSTRQQGPKRALAGWTPVSNNRGGQQHQQPKKRRRRLQQEEQQQQQQYQQDLQQQQQQLPQPFPTPHGGSCDLQDNDSTLGGENSVHTSFEAMLFNATTDGTETSMPLFSTMPTIPELELWDNVDMSRLYDADISTPLPTDSDDREVDLAIEQPVIGDSPSSATGSSRSSTATKPIEWELSAPSMAGNAIQQLCALSVKLTSQVQFLHSANLNTSEDSMPRLEQLAGRVIENTVAFHRILSEVQSMLEASDGPDPLLSHTAMILEVLAVYIRLTQLHDAFYQEMKSALIKPSKCLSPEPSPSDLPVPFPALHIGGVSLSPYPRFQLKFILQICVHHLGEVEALLGLPMDFCVSERMTEAGGILHRSRSEITVLVRSVMKQAEKTVKGIRSVLVELAEETKGAIQV
ncbi:hypothetical protein ABHI18_011093 [Aspergillus niger]